MRQPPQKPPRRKSRQPTLANGTHAALPRERTPGATPLSDRGGHDQGIFEDERGQEQPADKRRAVRNR